MVKSSGVRFLFDKIKLEHGLDGFNKSTLIRLKKSV